jgi:DNA-binding NtrC family response regulator
VNHRRYVVLVVDDEERVRQVICERLEDAGLQVIEASSGDEAWTLVQTNVEIDLILTDVRMPGTMNGFDLVDAALASRPTLKTILMSGYGGEAFNRTIQAGLFLPKPFTMACLLTNVERLLYYDRPVGC